ncbi:10769_t:CDS:1 [Racocetra fulgida]|uniref:10769_t:CDS:1 n=1 Tax=Racocetra fulgida TaxID=60492 RepID=A0A9N9EAY1_9GLOM|nr:10769_t:CDS:1 [Racocetra fulgida]
MSTTLMRMLGMLCYNLQQKLPEALKKKTKKQTLSTNLINIPDVENPNIDLLFEEKEFEKPLEFDVEAISIDIKDKLIIEEFFDIDAFEQSQNISAESSDTHLQNAAVSTKDWSINDIF